MVIKILVFTGVLLVTACSSFADNRPGYTVIKQFNLPPELAETSGLYCPEQNTVYTINDSGNKPILYQLNLLGEIQQQFEIDAKNRDWESLTGDDKSFYIGDIGNNNGKRKAVEIYVVDKNTDKTQLTRTLEISYLYNSINKNEYLNHDFDAEAFVSVDDKLILFSKSWQTTNLHIYELSKTELKQKVEPVATLEGLPGLVTGVDYNVLTKEYVLVGYSLYGLGSFSPFIAKMDKHFKLIASYPLTGFNQVEGVCVSPNGEVWISQESSFFSTHKLAKLLLR
ncbi:hypothetical protein AX660_18750 [Paraglaciecola hydrolytica]|uniref:Phytase-like domain-containing protein n=1 Tax=Paraglaciecola hydrolytica TaxID=1799789 RepID=A0A148KNT6_9ALTE|nr:hypothetical protein AX660_18750 [Paraglaciecola hydrolytica]